ncbi:hypothetical protein N493_15010 [Clostridium botulinum B2 433]|uniref:hypothetical protein n=1 Tax=Clostridium botulinum TaxID=1491 RepID=UPI0007E07E37|nr:hypothetical protein [Clostridium botulinum]KEI90716.1 hypothetical protein N493_15010 [Clostridium botulinum B2 433]
MDTSLNILKFNLQERQFSYFSDEELEMLLKNNNSDIKKASYQGCIMKAQADDGINLGPLKTESNRSYWLTLANSFKTKEAYNYNTSLKRVDGQ